MMPCFECPKGPFWASRKPDVISRATVSTWQAMRSLLLWPVQMSACLLKANTRAALDGLPTVHCPYSGHAHCMALTPKKVNLNLTQALSQPDWLAFSHPEQPVPFQGRGNAGTASVLAVAEHADHNVNFSKFAGSLVPDKQVAESLRSARMQQADTLQQQAGSSDLSLKEKNRRAQRKFREKQRVQNLLFFLLLQQSAYIKLCCHRVCLLLGTENRG